MKSIKASMLLILDTSELPLTTFGWRSPATRHFIKTWHEPSILTTAFRISSPGVELLDSGNPRYAPQTDLELASTKPAGIALSIQHDAKCSSRCLYQPHGLLIYVTRRGSGLIEWSMKTVAAQTPDTSMSRPRQLVCGRWV